MEPFPPAQEPDEGYSEHPLYPSADSSALLLGNAARTPTEFSNWLAPRMSNLSVAEKTQLAMAILNELPTHVIADIVLTQLNPRLYIDFVDYLPTEICLKIFGYLDPVSLIHVAQSCRGWHELAADRKLWEKLFYLEGWRALPKEIALAEERMNAGLSSTDVMHPQRLRSSEYGHAHKKRAISDPTPHDSANGGDSMDLDGDQNDSSGGDTEMAGTSLFGGPGAHGNSSSSKSTATVVQNLGHLMMASPSPLPDSPGREATPHASDAKGKGKAKAEVARDTPIPLVTLPALSKASLWSFDTRDMRYKINWQWLYTMRRRLEYNWETGKYTNFQLPHPDYPQEGHKECIYSLQFNSAYLVSGSRDRTLRIWNMQTRRLVRQPLRGHTGSVLCLQFDSDPEEDLIVSGSSDSDVIIWKFSTGQMVQRLTKAHTESVLNVKFDKRILVTCSKDKTIKIFNRRPLHPGDQGYGDIKAVSAVPTRLLKHPDHQDFILSQLPLKPPYTQIGCLEGHGAAVNAVQICGSEIVSASGDRHIKVWDWPNQICRRTFLGHNKGIACVQYDGRRIVSGSSDNEVKVFDRETGLEVASLRAHTSLVRTVQAGFGDLAYSAEEDRNAAKQVDEEYFKAFESGKLGDSHLVRGKALNAGSRRPEDITAYGAKLPPGGGGGPYGRIVSGSYDQTVIIWRRDKEGVWRSAHTLRQEDAAASAMRQPSVSRAASPPTPAGGVSPRADTQVTAGTSTRPLPSVSAPPAMHQMPTPPPAHIMENDAMASSPGPIASSARMIDLYVSQGPTALRIALVRFPGLLNSHSQIQSAIDREPNAAIRAQLRQVVTAALLQARIAQNRAQVVAATSAAADHPTTHMSLSSSSSQSSSSGSLPPSTGRPSHQQASTPPAPHLSQSSAAAQGSSSRLGALLQARNRPRNQASSSRAAATAHTGDSQSSIEAVAGSSSSASAGPPAPNQGTPRAAYIMQHPPQHPSFVQDGAPTMTQSPAAAQGGPPAPAPAPATLPGQHHPHIAQTDSNPRVFKLQFDARRIICCSQTSTIVGWDFSNGDPELEEATRFFGPME